MKKTIIVNAYFQSSQRTPIMTIENNRQVSLETLLSEILQDELKTIVAEGHYNFITNYCYKNQPKELQEYKHKMTPVKTNKKSEILPLTKKLKITIQTIK